jgi:hypothetical protein
MVLTTPKVQAVLRLTLYCCLTPAAGDSDGALSEFSEPREIVRYLPRQNPCC